MGVAVTLKFTGQEQLRKALEKFGEEFRKEIQTHNRIIAESVRTAAIKRIQRGPATGRVYEKYKPRRSHQASAPGQPPMSDTGTLASSVAVADVPGRSEVRVGTPLDYGRALELGTKNIRPRPWLNPSLEEARRPYEAGLKPIFDRAAKKSAAKKLR